jgi:hypothetical protein
MGDGRVFVVVCLCGGVERGLGKMVDRDRNEENRIEVWNKK